MDGKCFSFRISNEGIRSVFYCKYIAGGGEEGVFHNFPFWLSNYWADAQTGPTLWKKDERESKEF